MYNKIFALCEHSYSYKVIEKINGIAKTKDLSNLSISNTSVRSDYSHLQEESRKQVDEKLKKQKASNACFAEGLLSYYDPKNMNVFYDTISSCIVDDHSSLTKKLVDQNSLLTAGLYKTIWFLMKRNIDSALKISDALMASVLNKEGVSGCKTHIERTQKLIIVGTSLLVVALSLFPYDKKELMPYTLDIREINTFLCEVLLVDKLESVSEIFNKLKVSLSCQTKVDKMEGVVISQAQKSRKDLCIALSILLKLGAPQLAITILLKSIKKRQNSEQIIMGWALLISQLNNNILNGKEDLAREYLKYMKKAIEIIVRYCPINMLKQNLQEKADLQGKSLLSSLMGISNPTLGSVIFSLSLSPLSIHVQSLLNNASLLPSKIMEPFQKSYKTPIELSIFVCKFAKVFYDCSLDLCQKVFAFYFTNRTEATIFNVYIQELAQIMAIAVYKGIIEFTPDKQKPGNYLKIHGFHTPKQEEEIALGVVKTLKVFWKLGLLIEIEQNKEKSIQEASSEIKLACSLIRFSALTTNEMNQLEYIQLGLKLLKTINYQELNTANDKDNNTIKDLAQVIDIYIEKWKILLGGDKEQVMSAIKTVN